MNLTAKDIATIRKEKKIGIISPVIFVMAGGLFNFFYLFGSKNVSYILLGIMNIVILGFCILIYRKLTDKYNSDLLSGIKKIKLETIQSKEQVTTYEAGSGTLYIPILGDIFPKLWGQRMKPEYKFILTINGNKYEVEKDLYDKVSQNETVEMYYSECSETLLGIKKA